MCRVGTTLRRARRAAARIAATALIVVLAASGCGSPPHTTPPSTDAAGHNSSGPIAVHYEARGRSSEGSYRAQSDLVAADPTHVRYRIRVTGYAPLLYVYDGQRLLVHDPEEFRHWILYKAPSEHPDQLAVVSHVFTKPASAAFRKQCRSARLVGHRVLLGRQAVGYHCAARHYRDGSTETGGVEWLDAQSGLLLQAGPLRATAIDDHPLITRTTFSTVPPRGAAVETYAARRPPGSGLRTAPGFRLRELGGGRVSLADYAGKPLVLAFYMSDIVFDTSGDSCPRCVPALLALQRLTSAGTHPAVLAIQVGDVGKPGYPLIPRGLRLDVANDPDLEVQHAYGLSNQVGFVFIGSDLKVHRSFDNAPTDQQLASALDTLN